MKLSKKWRVFFLFVTGLVVLWLVYYASISIIYGAKLRNLKAQVKAEGSSLDLVKLASHQRRRSLEAKENAAFLYRAAGFLMDMRTGSDEIPGIAAYSDFLMAAQPGERAKFVSEKRQDLETWLRDSAIPLQLLHQAARYGHAWFDLDYSQGGQMKLPHLAQLRSGARLLTLEAWLAAEQGDAHKAFQSAWAGLRLRRAIEKEPLLISYLVGIATDGIVLRNLQEILPIIQPGSEDLRLILAEVQSRDVKQLRHAMEGERALKAMHFESVRRDGIARHWQFNVMSDTALGGNRTIASVTALIVRLLNSMPVDESFSLAYMNRLLQAASKVNSLSPDEVKYWLDDEGGYREKFRSLRWQSYHPFSIRLVPALGRAFVEAKRDIARHDVAACGIAAELYRLDYGAYPTSLDALVPDYLSVLPQDTFSGKPLLFKALPDGILIYSLGRNGRDDGGVEDSEMPDRPDDVAWRVDRNAPAAAAP